MAPDRSFEASGPANKPRGGKLLRRPRAPKLPSVSLEPSTHQPYTIDGLDSSSTPSHQPPQQANYASTTNLSDLDTPSHSPPPPTESLSRPYSEIRGAPPIRKQASDGRYMLDKSHREKTNLGTYVEGQTLVRPYRPRGPAGLPYREPAKRNPPLTMVPLDDDDDRYYNPPAFTLQDFTLKLMEKVNVPLEQVQTTIFSRHTYKKLQRLLVDQCIPKHTQLNVVHLEPTDDLPNVSPRIPHQQLLLEMAALVKEQMSGVVGGDVRSVIRPLPRYTPHRSDGQPQPHTEILLYEDHTKDRQRASASLRQYVGDSEIPGHDNIFHGGPPRYFQGSRRSNSPFAAAEEGLISPSELAVLDSIMSGGVALSLKAHFIAQLPDIEPLARTVTYLNLSFNDFRFIPVEVFELTQLTVLKLRNNPIKDISPDIGSLANLRVLVLSFCLISSLPPSLFELTKLHHLDIAYNKISDISQDIRKLRHLRELNLEGNQLAAMPAAALRLNRLKYVRVRNNYMHPLFWKENTVNQPQRLMDLAALTVRHQNLTDSAATPVPDHISLFLKRHEWCDLCRGPRYGPGLVTIRPISSIYQIQNLPVMFRCCSVDCLARFSENSDGLMEMLYGEGGPHMGDNMAVVPV